MDSLLIAGVVGLVVGIGSAWVVGGEDGLPLFLIGGAIGAGGMFVYLKYGR